jgi:peptidyl-prolyl cis-trans isomerase D
MLDNLRANKGGIITYVFLFAIIIVFVVSFGPGSFDKGCTGAQGPVWAARVNGQDIPAADWERAHQNLLRSFQQQAGQAFTRELAEQLGLGTMALNQLVERALAVQEARRVGLAITDDELRQTITGLPAFQRDGAFDKDTYKQTVAGLYGSAARFEEVLREDLIHQRMMAGLSQTVKVADAEVKEAWTAEHDRVSLDYVRFPVAAAQAEVRRPTDAEAAAFALKEPARIEKAYQEAAARYDQPKKVRARHILVKTGPGYPAPDEAPARKKIEALAARLAKGEDFAKVAAEASEDENTRAKGGDLGFVTEGLVEKAFADAALQLEAGKVSQPVRTTSGWHLIKADAVVPAKRTPIEAARTELGRELLVKDRGAALARERATAALAAVKAGRKLADLFPAGGGKARGKAATLGGTALAVESTGPFGAGGAFVPKLGTMPGLAEAAMALQPGQPLPAVQDSPQGPVVAVVASRERPDPARFDRERAEVAARLRNRREAQVQQAWLKALRDAADVKVNDALVGAAAAAAGAR